MVTITTELLKRISPSAKAKIIVPVAASLTTHLAMAEVNTLFRVAHFLAQAAHESDGFKTLYEYWGPTEDQKGYENAARLGNNQPGDGFRFRGRGIFQVTGRANYQRMGDALNLDLVNNPELAADPENAVALAVYYWEVRNLNQYADADDIRTITKKINGGYNGLRERTAYLAIAKQALNEM